MSESCIPAVLVIGGIDPQGCSGLAADIKTIEHHGAHAVPLVTCLTEQTSQGLSHLGAVDADQFMANYQSCIADFDIAAIKIGLIPTLEIAHCISQILQQHSVPCVFDPVLAATSGGKQADEALRHFCLNTLLAKVSILTPNIPELELLTGDKESVSASQSLLAQGLSACLVKGGHASGEWATDYFVTEDYSFYLYQQKHDKSVRGTGCCLASSIAAQLAFNQDPRDAVVLAKAYVARGIRTAKVIGPYAVLSHSSAPVLLQDLPKLCYSADLIGSDVQFPPCPQALGIYPVVDNADWIEKLLDEGIKTIQLRMKDASSDERQHHIQAAVESANAHGETALFINDYWQDAINAGAYGVHLGQEDLHEANVSKIAKSGLRLGVSTHSYWELSRALAIKPSYIALGPIFETDSKIMPFSPQGIDRLALWVDLLSGHYPLVAIGGINLARAKQLKTTGVGSVAMISAITKADDYRLATQSLLQSWL